MSDEHAYEETIEILVSYAEVPEATRLRAVELAFGIATRTARESHPNAADPGFITLLLELFKILLPIILELLAPKD